MTLGCEVDDGLDNAGTLGEWAFLAGSRAKGFLGEPESWERERGHCITSSSMQCWVGGGGAWEISSAVHWRL